MLSKQSKQTNCLSSTLLGIIASIQSVSGPVTVWCQTYRFNPSQGLLTCTNCPYRVNDDSHLGCKSKSSIKHILTNESSAVWCDGVQPGLCQCQSTHKGVFSLGIVLAMLDSVYIALSIYVVWLAMVENGNLVFTKLLLVLKCMYCMHPNEEKHQDTELVISDLVQGKCDTRVSSFPCVVV